MCQAETCNTITVVPIECGPSISVRVRHLAHRGLRVELEEPDRRNDLELRDQRDVLPELRRGDTRRAELVAGNLPREVDA